MSNTFKVGDTVRLKSGGVLMTINALRGEDNDFAMCVWQDGKKASDAIYNLAALEHSTNAIGAVAVRR